MENQTYEIVDYVHDEVMTFAYAFSVLGLRESKGYEMDSTELMYNNLVG